MNNQQALFNNVPVRDEPPADLCTIETPTGARSFVADVSRLAAQTPAGPRGSWRFLCRAAERYAFICVRDCVRPLRFLRQMEGAPPLRFGRLDFCLDLVDDDNPARHYMAFVFVGFFAGRWLGAGVLLLWEILGFVRYRGQWSAGDVRLGFVGLRHGRLLKRFGPTIMPSLIARDLCEE